MSQPDTTQLHQFLVDHFSFDELKTLCLNLKVRYDDLGGEGLTGRARELVLYMERHGRIVDLCAVLAQLRPDSYHSAFGETAAEQTVTATPPRRGRRFVERNPRQVFVSHAVGDGGVFAHRLAYDLRRGGYTTWIAPESIPDGQWVSAINRGLAESGVMLLVLTPGALESPWVEMETNVAIELERAGEMRFIPVCLERGRYDPMWHAYQWVMFDREYAAGLNELLRRLKDPLPNPLPPGEGTGRRIHAKSGIELIRIPAGPFLYGSADSGKMAFDGERPQRTVDLPEYWIGRAPVTNDQFARFVRATGHQTTAERQGYGWGWTGTGKKWGRIQGANWLRPRGTESSSAGRGTHPVVQVNWDDAKAFCDWAGLALPSEEQWEKAARGTDGRIWPWGNEPPTAEHCNFNRNVGDTTPVGDYSPKGDSPYGCWDMTGNVWEWMGSWYSEGIARALRGGSWVDGEHNTRTACCLDDDPDSRDYIVGFRVVELLSDPGS
jgi:formylglycine-generating enzyme required for sulfatase activity